MSRDEFSSKKTTTTAAVGGLLRRLLQSITLFVGHHGYFVGVCLVSSLVFWASSFGGRPPPRVGYVDSLYLVVSAITETGLNTVNLSQINTWQQTILFLLILFGGSVWASIWRVLVKKWAFERQLGQIVAAECATAGVSLASAGGCQGLLQRIVLQLYAVSSVGESGFPVQRGDVEDGAVVLADATYSSSNTAFSRPLPITRRRLVGRNENDAQIRADTLRCVVGRHMSDGDAHVSTKLTTQERCRLGGVEYRAIRLLAVALPLYSALWQILGCLALAVWIQTNLPGPALNNGISPIWLGIFNGASAFNNSGMSLLDANMVPFNQAYFVLVTMGAMILAGNTAYPIFLRLSFWATLEVLLFSTAETVFADFKATLDYILKHSNDVHPPHLYPSRQTWWLAGSVVLINTIMWVAFELLNLGNPAVESLPKAARVIDGLFQAIAVRSGGFMVIPMSQIYVGLQLLYTIMMYIPVHPVAMKKSTIYEGSSTSSSSIIIISNKNYDRRLSRPIPRNIEDAEEETTRAFLAGQFKAIRVGQNDVWWLVAAVLIIATLETSHFLGDPVTWSIFNIIFEVVSAYGCVGVSIGVPFDSFSFSGVWSVPSKLILCLVMLRGRHRGIAAACESTMGLPGKKKEVMSDAEGSAVGGRS